MLVLFCLFGCFSCGTNLSPEKTLVVGMRWEPRTFNPFRSVDSASYFAQSLVYSGLVRYDQNGNIEGDLAESFQLDHEKGKLLFQLRQNIYFSDGTRITSSDVVSSINEASGIRSPFSKNFEQIKSVSAHENTVEIDFQGTDASFLSRFVDLKILPSKVLESTKSQRSRFDRMPVSSGAFLVEKWKSGQVLTFKRNSYYWDKKPSFEYLAWKVIPDKKLMAMALVRKEIDIASVGGREAKQLMKDSKDIEIEKAFGSRVVFLGFNTKREPFNLEKIRQALCLVVDRQKIKEILYENYSLIPDSEFSDWACNEVEGESKWSFNTRKAEHLLAEAGYVRKNGLWSKKESLSLKIVTVKDFVDLGQVLVSGYKRFGIQCELEVLDYATLKDQYLKQSSFDTVLFSRSVGPVPDPRMFWSKNGNLNYSGFSTEKLERLIDKGTRAKTLEEKRQINEKVGSYLADKLPWIYLQRPYLLIAHNKRVEGIFRGKQKAVGVPWNNFLLNARLWKIKP